MTGDAPTIERLGSLDAADAHVQVAIVGAGACGLTAALRALSLGAACVVLERDEAPGGSTALSSGFVPACGTRQQREAGVDDDVERFVADIQAKARGTAAPELTLAYARASGPALDWLCEQETLPLELLDGFLYPGHSVRRMHAMPQRTGRALVDALAARAQARGAAILTRATVRTLVLGPDERVLGVRFRRPDGALETLACDALVLACNGYGGDRERVARCLPAMRDAVFAGHVGNDGSAIAWGEALGAGVADLGGYQGHGSWATPHGVLVTWAPMTRGAIQVNASGERFHDESGGYSEAAIEVLAQPGAIAWNVLDEPLHRLALEFPDYRAALAAGAVRSAPDVATLARMIGCDAEVLAATLAEVASAARDGRPDRHGRRFERALSTPLRAVRVTGALFHTQGGLDIDAECRVRRTSGATVPNLFAAGGAARGVSGNAVWGYLSGNGLLSAVAGGWLAGAGAARTPAAAKHVHGNPE